MARYSGFANGNPIVVAPCDAAESCAVRVAGPAEDLVGHCENTLHDKGGKNDWHAATVTKVSDTVLRWTNRAYVSWTLTLTPDKNVLLVGNDNPYFSQGYKTARVIWCGNLVAAIYGPGDEPFERQGVRTRSAAERQQRAQLDPQADPQPQTPQGVDAERQARQARQLRQDAGRQQRMDAEDQQRQATVRQQRLAVAQQQRPAADQQQRQDMERQQRQDAERRMAAERGTPPG